ncbi:MAG: hypothetical protein H6811_07280 [Phycisphaeraceae bacterium]|nr:hypothetical protein [Phycisphaeraceae bacterium]
MADRAFQWIVSGVAAALLAGIAPWSLAASAAPSPEPNPVATEWEFDIDPGDLRVVRLYVPGEGMRSFYYFTYMVTNDTGEDLFFAPMIELGTDQGEVMLAGRDVPASVTQELIRRLRNPFMEDPIRVIGPIQQGVENAKDSIAIWPVGSTEVDEVSLYLMNFSGETKVITVRDAKTGNPKPITLRKTLMLRFKAPGNLLELRDTMGGRVLPRVESRWILRRAETIVPTASDSTGGGIGHADERSAPVGAGR